MYELTEGCQRDVDYGPDIDSVCIRNRCVCEEHCTGHAKRTGLRLPQKRQLCEGQNRCFNCQPVFLAAVPDSTRDIAPILSGNGRTLVLAQFLIDSVRIFDQTAT